MVLLPKVTLPIVKLEMLLVEPVDAGKNTPGTVELGKMTCGDYEAIPVLFDPGEIEI